MYFCGNTGPCQESPFQAFSAMVWVARTWRMWARAERWLGLSFPLAERYRITLRVAEAAEALNDGGFAGNPIPWRLWQQEVCAYYRDTGRPGSADAVARRP